MFRCDIQPVAGFFIAAFGALMSCSDEDDPLKAQDLQTEMLRAVNALRANGCQCGQDFISPVDTLVWSEALRVAAERRAVDMHHHNYFDHLSADGTSPIMRAKQAGYDGEYVGENIARYYDNVAGVVQGWQESESHCRLMMDTLYNEMGAGQSGGYWVLNLGRSK